MSLKGPRPAEFSVIRNLLGSLSLFFWGHFGVAKSDTVHVGPRNTVPKISAISYLFRTFSLLIMGDTERPRYTDFRGLSVCGITALQCIRKISCFRYFKLQFVFFCLRGFHFDMASEKTNSAHALRV